MKMFEFTITLVGTGEDEKEAWHDVCEHLLFDSIEQYEIPHQDDIKLLEEWED